MTRRAVVRTVVLVCLSAVVIVGLMPFLLRERPGPRTISDSATTKTVSTAFLTGSVDELAAAARGRGYTCQTPEIQSIRGCQRSEGGYTYDLWMQGTDTYLAELNLSVTAIYRTHTRAHWVAEMTTVLSGIPTDQSRHLSAWLTENGNAGQTEASVDGLPFHYFVRAGGYTKETFGGVAHACGRIVDAVENCAPLHETT